MHRLRLPAAVRILLSVVLLALMRVAQAQNPRTIVVLYDGLTVDDLHDPACPHLAALARSGAVGLMSTAVAGAPTYTSAMLTLALGAQAPAEATDEEAYESRTERTEGASAGIVFERRTAIDPWKHLDGGPHLFDMLLRGSRMGYTHPAPPPPAEYAVNAVVHLGIASLTRRGLNDRLVGSVLGATGRPGSLTICGNADTDRPGRRVALFAIDAQGIAPRGVLAPPAANDPLALAQFAASRVGAGGSVVIHLGDGARAETARQGESLEQYHAVRRAGLARLDTLLDSLLSRISLDSTRLLIASPEPPAGPTGAWDRLTPVVLAGAAVRPALLTSATTRTAGLVANTDVAPSLLTWLGAPTLPSMTGHPIGTISSHEPLATIATMDRTVTGDARASLPIYWGLAALGGVTAVAIAAALTFAPALRPLCAASVVFLMNFPLAALFVTPFQPRTVATQIAITFGIMAGLGTAEGALVRALRRRDPVRYATASVPLAICILTAGSILVDTLFGQPLIKYSVFSAGQLQGIRFYGVGNEYMGVTVGVVLLGVFLGRLPPPFAAALFTVVTLILGLPFLGAKAGVMIVGAVAFGLAWERLSGRKPGWYSVVLWCLAGIVGAFCMAGIDSTVAARGLGAASHMGGALETAGQRGYGYLAELAWRKALMNLRVTTNPGMLYALGVVGAVVALGATRFRSHIDTLAMAHPEWARGVGAAAWGAAAAYLFNDAGAIAGIFLFGAFVISGVYFLLTDPIAHNVAQASNPIMEAAACQPAASGVV